MTQALQLKIKRLTPTAKLPTRGSIDSAGLDVCADYWEQQSDGILVHTGIAIEPPEGTYVIAVPRSSTPKHGLYLANSVGIIDPDYRGEVRLKFVVKPGMGRSELYDFLNTRPRIAQLLIVPFIFCTIAETTELTETVRGSGGFGSTGVE